MKAALVTIGDEILIGQIVDTNSAWLGTELNQNGILVSQILSVSDSAQAIVGALEQSLDTAELVIITGGLGPTKDDITKTTLSTYFKTDLVIDTEVLSDVSRFLGERGVELTELNRLQAMVPANATVLRNRIGTAPGLWFTVGGKVVVSLPGVPWEMKDLIQREVLPRVQQQFSLPSVKHWTVLTHGIPESILAARLEAWEDALPGELKLAYLPGPGQVRLRMSIAGSDAPEQDRIISEQLHKLQQLIPEAIWGHNEETMPQIVGDLLNGSGLTVSTAESCSGGLIASQLTTVAGSSAYFKGAVVAYDNLIKEQVLGVGADLIRTHGAVSQQVVEQMAKGVMALMDTDCAIATSGIAGPSGGTADKPVGTVWIAVATPKGVQSAKYLFGKERDRNISKTMMTALDTLRKALL